MVGVNKAMLVDSVREFDVIHCQRWEISDFIEKNHYSHNINGCISDYCFKLVYDGDIIGAAFFGRMAMANQWKRFSDSQDDVIELRRLCCIDETPKNTESYFIGKMIRWLKKNTNIKVIVSYADKEHGHDGTIYKASNFKYMGFKKGAKVIVYGEKQYHDKALRTKYNGKLKPFAVRLKQALDNGDAYLKETAGKHTYVYKIN